MKYRATYLDAEGSRATAVMDAADEQELHEHLHSRGHLLLQARHMQSAAEATSQLCLNRRQQLAFVQSMGGALDAGVPLLTTLAAMSHQEDNPRIAAMYREISERVAGGEAFSEVLSTYPRSFPNVVSALVRAGESSGSLPTVLHSLAGYLEWRQQVVATVKQALLYPIIVLSAGYGLVLFLMSFVIPRLGEVLSKVSADLPLASRLLIDLSGIVAANVGWIVLATVILMVGAGFAARSFHGQRLFAGLMSRMPVAANVLHTLNVAQFCRNLGIMLQAGITVTTALDLCAGTIAVKQDSDAILRARDRIISGGRLTDALDEMEFLPPVAMSMVRVGETAGRLPDTFESLSSIYDREVKAAVHKALALFEPAVTILLGIIVGGVAVLVVSTIYTAMRGIGR